MFSMEDSEKNTDSRLDIYIYIDDGQQVKKKFNSGEFEIY